MQPLGGVGDGVAITEMAEHQRLIASPTHTGTSGFFIKQLVWLWLDIPSADRIDYLG